MGTKLSSSWFGSLIFGFVPQCYLLNSHVQKHTEFTNLHTLLQDGTKPPHAFIQAYPRSLSKYTLSRCCTSLGIPCTKRSYTSVRDTFFWLVPAAIATLFSVPYLTAHYNIVTYQNRKISVFKASIYEQKVQNLVRSMSSAVALSLTCSQVVWAIVGEMEIESLRPIRDSSNVVDGEATEEWGQFAMAAIIFFFAWAAILWHS